MSGCRASESEMTLCSPCDTTESAPLKTISGAGTDDRLRGSHPWARYIDTRHPPESAWRWNAVAQGADSAADVLWFLSRQSPALPSFHAWIGGLNLRHTVRAIQYDSYS
eukprot:COSAG05_NODE_780_length_7383_cov_123.317408_3_plen_109_part_00